MSKKKEALEPPELRETPERSQHSPVDDVAFKPKGGKAVQTVRRVRYEHPLDVMLHRSLLTDKQYDLATLLYRNWRDENSILFPDRQTLKRGLRIRRKNFSACCSSMSYLHLLSNSNRIIWNPQP